MSVERKNRSYKKITSTIWIEEDGWVWIRRGKKKHGIGDLGVDVKIIDKREKPL